jgi:hypothetical protein
MFIRNSKILKFASQEQSTTRIPTITSGGILEQLMRLVLERLDEEESPESLESQGVILNLVLDHSQPQRKDRYICLMGSI